MLKNLFTEQRQQLDHFFSHVDLDKAQAFVDTCLACKGLIVFTGVGKSGLIAEKIALTLVSTGTKALFLPPTNFLHGDLGILTENDVLIMISKSGESEELLNLIPFVKKRNTTLLSMVSNPQGRLSKESDLHIVLPMEKELCPFDLAPTTSTVIQLIFGDILAVALMRAKEFSLSEYVLNHPSGAIGKKLSLSVKEIMIKEAGLPLCQPEDRLVDVLTELSNKQCGCLIVVNQERELLGIFTDGDLRRALQHHGSSIAEESIQNFMTRTPRFVTQDLLAWEVLKVMQKDPKRWIMVAPVVNQGKVVGIVRMHDIVKTGLT